MSVWERQAAGRLSRLPMKMVCLSRDRAIPIFSFYPGYSFKMMDVLITNFHLPESTLLMLVSALAGKEQVMRVYEEAVQERYRFFSFGDAMIILDD